MFDVKPIKYEDRVIENYLDMEINSQIVAEYIDYLPKLSTLYNEGFYVVKSTYGEDLPEVSNLESINYLINNYFTPEVLNKLLHYRDKNFHPYVFTFTKERRETISDYIEGIDENTNNFGIIYSLITKLVGDVNDEIGDDAVVLIDPVYISNCMLLILQINVLGVDTLFIIDEIFIGEDILTEEDEALIKKDFHTRQKLYMQIESKIHNLISHINLFRQLNTMYPITIK